MASRVTFSQHQSTPAHPTTPARNRRLSNFHKLVSSPDPIQTPVAQRTPLRPFNRQTPTTNPRRQSFAPKNFHPNPRLSPSSAHHDQRPRQPNLSRAEIAQMYSSTIKLCQDNKINARNTWTLNLIDYMSMLVKDDQHSDKVSRTVSFQDDAAHEPSSHSLLDTLSTQSASTADTNFQLAGVTLDAGVKIYCSRVDSVHTNAFKVLGGLSRTGNQPGSTSDDESDPNNQSADPEKKRQRSAKRTGRSTLETNMANITSRKLETDLTVDPLFHKMSAAFDEGGAKGMLMNNLPVGPQGQVLFDSSEPAEDLTSAPRQQESETCPAPSTQVYNISEVLPTEGIEDSDGICSKFLRFYTAKKRLFDNIESTDSTGPATLPGDQPEPLAGADDDMFAENQEFGFDYDDGDLQNAGELGVFPTHDAIQDISAAQDDDEVQLYTAGEDDPRRFSVTSNMSLAMAAQRGGLDLVEAGMALQGNSSYAFFDTSSLSGWAGPQHWRFQAMTASSGVSSNGATKDGSKKTKRPRGKTAMLLDFSSAAPTVDFAKEFEPGRTESSYQLSSSVRDGFSEKKVTLPEDLHYSIRNLAGLFLRPSTVVKPKSVWKDNGNEQLKPNDGEEWYDFENDCDNDNFCPLDNSGSFDAGDEQHGISNVHDGDLGMELLDEPTRVEKIDITYARVAKKVDVRQLKSGLWSKLCGESMSPGIEADGNESRAPQGEAAGTEGALEGDDIRGGMSQRLQNLVSEMPSFVPADSLPDVSLPYVFICLLHLANEKALKITQDGNDSLADLIITSETLDNS